MQKAIGIALVLFVAVASASYSPTYTGPDWQKRKASDKQNTLEGRIVSNTNTIGWYPEWETAGILLEDMSKSFDTTADDMPAATAGFFSFERKKLIHTVGSMARAAWVDLGGHNYTGIFQGGCNNTFLRFSHAAPPADVTIPGISVKFMRDGVHSGNTLALYSLAGQSSFNFFAHDISNHPPNPDPSKLPFTKKKLLDHFGTASKWPSLLGLSDMAHYNALGQSVLIPVFPYRLVYHPTAAVHSLFPDDPQDGSTYFLAQLDTLSPGPVYEVYAQPTPFSEALIGPIARLDLLERPTSTQFGDKDLFFQHTRMENDIAVHPEWRSPMEAILQQQLQAFPNNAYPDLPFNSTTTRRH